MNKQQAPLNQNTPLEQQNSKGEFFKSISNSVSQCTSQANWRRVVSFEMRTRLNSNNSFG